VTGYQSPAYAAALSEFGEPFVLPTCGGQVLVRQIPGTAFKDAIGTYPLFACTDWELLDEDLVRLDPGLVSLGVVPDPFGKFSVEGLRRAFPDICVPFKTHFVVDLSVDHSKSLPASYRRNIRHALGKIVVVSSESPGEWLDDWVALYDELIARHRITGITRFSRWSFARQLDVPGIVAFREVAGDHTIGLLLWYAQGDVAYYHLGAHSQRGYELKAGYALISHAIEYFKARDFRWLSLGGGAGWKNDGTDGLSSFKKGWATGSRTAWFCGRIFDHDRYRELARNTGTQGTSFFPSYRAPGAE
jgi:hypothetical protein